jgi:RNA recognition motif-containing protein
MPKRELFVGNLDRDIERNRIEDVFEKYGKLLKCELKNRGNL